MTEAPRRTDEHNLRQAISDILEQTYAIEYSMGLFYRKGTERELERAQEDLEIMRAAVDRLDALITRAHQDDETDAKVVEPQPHHGSKEPFEDAA